MDINEQILTSLNAALNSIGLYPKGHPSTAAPARKTYTLLKDFFKTENKFSIALIDEALVFDEVPVVDAEEQFGDIINAMRENEVEAIIFEKGLIDGEIISLIDILTLEEKPKGEALQKQSSKLGIRHITLKTIENIRPTIEVYNDAIDIVKDLMGEVRMGKIPDSAPVISIVEEISDQVLADHDAMVGLSMIKNYDDYLYNHSVNVGIISLSIAKQMGLSQDDVKLVGIGGILHDIGKTGVAEEIIKKPGGLSNDEWEKIKEHPTIGGNIMKHMKGVGEEAMRMAMEHHVRYDHSGYPDIQDIHPYSFIVSIADAYDALTTLRVYQKPYPPVDAVKILKELSGKHFPPEVVDAFMEMVGMYPIGTLVRLNTNEAAVVTHNHDDNQTKPIVKIAFDIDGNRLSDSIELDLADAESNSDNKSIIAPIDPISRDIVVSEFLEQEAQKAAAQQHAEEGTA